jgi:hypothetical protein
MEHVLLTLLFTGLCLGDPAQEAQRQSLPDSAAQKEAEKLVHDIFKDDYARKTPGDKADLARKLLSQTEQPGNSLAIRYVLFREAQDLAVQAGDAALATKVVDTMARSFQVNAVALKLSALQAMAKLARPPEDAKPSAIRFLGLADEAMASDDYDVAGKAAEAAIQLARKSKELALVSKSEAKDKEVSSRKAAFERVAKARDTLTKNPDDPQANQIVGYHLCAAKGDWKSGLPLLAKGDEPNLRTLATDDLSMPDDPAVRVGLGDRWWELGEKSTDPARQNLRKRAGFWYAKMADSATGLSKAKIQKRLAELGQDKFGPKHLWVPLNDPRQFGINKEIGEPIELSAKEGMAVGASLKSPPGEIDAIAARIRFKPGVRAHAGISLEEKDKLLYISYNAKSVMFSHMVGKQWEVDVEKPCGEREEYNLCIVVAEGEYILYLDGEEVGRYKTRLARVTEAGLQASHGPAVFDQIRVRKKE